MLKIEQELLDQIYDECCKRYPDEACGVVFGHVEPICVAKEVVCCRNLQNEVHVRDPKRYPHDAKRAYTIDPKELEKIKQDASRKKMSLVAIFHSHPEHDVYFSEEDKNMAAPWGEPLFGLLSYIIVSVYDRQVKNASEFYWEETKKGFLERKIL